MTRRSTECLKKYEKGYVEDLRSTGKLKKKERKNPENKNVYIEATLSVLFEGIWKSVRSLKPIFYVHLGCLDNINQYFGI